MHFYCTCGNRISDTTDFLSNKAAIMANQDEVDFFDAVEREVKDEQITKEECLDRILFHHMGKYLNRNMYQCSMCGRLYVEDTSYHFHVFVPEGEVNKKLLTSAEGESWKGFLRGDWSDEKSEWRDYQGYIDVNVNTSLQGISFFHDKEEFQKRYYEMFEQLKQEGIIRSAVMKVNNHWIHHWEMPLVE